MAQRPLRIICRTATIALALLLNNGVSTSAHAAQGEQGILEIQVKDHRDAIGDFNELNITIEKLLISPKSGLKFWRAGWQELMAAPNIIDLTQYVGAKGVTVYRGPMDAGGFDGFHLKIKSIEGLLKNGRRRVSVKNSIGPVRILFDVVPRRETVLIIDLVVTDLSDHPPNGYRLGLRGYELYTAGKLIAKVPPG